MGLSNWCVSTPRSGSRTNVYPWPFVCFQVASIEDKTQLELREVDSTGTLQAGEKALADLRKRKLITQKSVCNDLDAFELVWLI